jgi:hypothetical protein
MIIHLYSRSDVEADWKCPRSRYWHTLYKGRGIERTTLSLDPTLGQIEHTAIYQLLAEGRLVDEVAAAAAAEIREVLSGTWRSTIQDRIADQEQFANEMAALCAGLVYGWDRLIKPRLLAEFDVFAMEKELRFTHAGGRLGMMTKPDLLLTPKDPELAANGKGYLELKTTSMSGPRWLAQWGYAVQFMAAALAAEQDLGEHIGFVLVQGLYKGRYEDEWLHSPLVWGWRKQDPEGLVEEEWSWECQRKKGWERTPAWCYPGGLAAWVANMPEDVLEGCFPSTTPIVIDEALLEKFVKQCERRETEIAGAKATLRAMEEVGWEAMIEEFLDEHFPQHFTACAPPIGFPCDFQDCCFQPVIARDPVGSGKYRWREPHHKQERVALGLDLEEEEVTTCA